MTIILQSHEYANIFPMMSADEYAALKAGMSKAGYDKRFPIWTHKGKIIDGRNRYRAARELNIRPVVVEFDGDESELMAFVIRANLDRRHLSETQRAGIASRLANMPLGGAAYRSANLQTDTANISIPQAADMLNVSPRTVTTYRAAAAT